MLRVLRRLPADDNLIVFETGVGRQYADSPRYVYEELVRRGQPDAQGLGLLRQDPHRDDLTPRRRSGCRPATSGTSAGRATGSTTRTSRTTSPPARTASTCRPGTARRSSGCCTTSTRSAATRATSTGSRRAAAQWSLLVSPEPVGHRRDAQRVPLPGPVLEVGYPRNDVLPRRTATRGRQRPAPARHRRRQARRALRADVPRRPGRAAAAGSASACPSTWTRCTQRWATTSSS